MIAFLLISGISYNLKPYYDELANRGEIYEVTSFVTKDTIRSNITDTLNWKRFVLMAGRSDTTNRAIIYYNNNNKSEHGDWCAKGLVTL